MAQVSDLNLISESLNQYIVRPLNAFGVGGFIFDIEGETTVNLTTEITDHFLEDNSTIQDHIAVKPKRLTLKSYVGELVYRQDDETETIAQKSVRKLTVLNQFAPTITNMASQLLDAKKSDFSLDNVKNFFSSRTVNQVTDFWAFTKNMIGDSSRQQQAYMYFKALMDQKILLSVQTPFEFMNRMAIESIVAIQSEDSKYISDFSITLKEIRFAEILNVPAGQTRYVTSNSSAEDMSSPRHSVQNSVKTNLGNIVGIDYSFDPDAIKRALEFH